MRTVSHVGEVMVYVREDTIDDLATTFAFGVMP
jgi:hypothetical protein